MNKVFLKNWIAAMVIVVFACEKSNAPLAPEQPAASYATPTEAIAQFMDLHLQGPTTPVAAVDMFIKIEDIGGEAQDSEHEDEIEVHGIEWGMTFHLASRARASAGETGQAHLNDFKFVKYVDKASTALSKMAKSEEHIPEAVLTLRKVGGGEKEALTFRMKDVFITSYSTGGGTEESESISLNYQKIVWE